MARTETTEARGMEAEAAEPKSYYQELDWIYADGSRVVFPAGHYTRTEYLEKTTALHAQWAASMRNMFKSQESEGGSEPRTAP